MDNKGKGPKKEVKKETSKNAEANIRLNKYVSNAGVCSRRDADVLIADGLVKVNGKVVKEMGHKVSLEDKVEYNGKVLNPEKKVYVLLNKPKDFITTVSDEKGRKTVMELVKNAADERLYPVGRLDRNTTGLLLMTNDGELTQQLSHPSYDIKKIYQVVLDKNVSFEDFQALQEEIVLEDGPITLDQASYVEKEGKNTIGVEIHSGRNRIVRRVFEHFNYEVLRLDRVVYAGLTKKDLPRGKWRHLTPEEVINFKGMRIDHKKALKKGKKKTS